MDQRISCQKSRICQSTDTQKAADDRRTIKKAAVPINEKATNTRQREGSSPVNESKRQDVTLETLTLFEINPHFRAVTYYADYQTFAETRFPCGGESHIINVLWVNGLAARNLESVRVRTRKKPQMTDAQ